MNIIIFNNISPNYGSGIIGMDLFNEFQKRGPSVKLLVNGYETDYPEGVISVETFFLFWRNKIINKVKRTLKLESNIVTDPKYHFHELSEDKHFYKTRRLLKKAKIKPDVILVLFTKDFINAKNIYELNQRTNAPIYWLIYDMAPLTGGCHYAWDCKGYQNNCGNCPGLYSSDLFDITYENIIFKKKYISRTNIQIITASEWQYRQAKSSSLFQGIPIHKVLLSINPSVFKQVNKQEIRLKLGIPLDKKVVFFGSMGLTDLRKGMLYLIESLKILKEKTRKNNLDLANNILLLAAGNNFKDIADDLPYEFLYLGFVDNTFGIASAFQAADVFICPSIEDSGPMMINQSIMCGIPVVSFDMGIALDLVETGKTGYRAKIKDSDDMAQGIYDILTLESDKYKMLSDNCRKLALTLCSPNVQIENLERIIDNSITN
jgi:glycosyltransferase involved in cell wall biosynthesis